MKPFYIFAGFAATTVIAVPNPAPEDVQALELRAASLPLERTWV